MVLVVTVFYFGGLPYFYGLLESFKIAQIGIFLVYVYLGYKPSVPRNVGHAHAPGSICFSFRHVFKVVALRNQA